MMWRLKEKLQQTCSVRGMDGTISLNRLRPKRIEAGALGLDLPEPEIILDLQGRQKGLFGRRETLPIRSNRRVHDCR